MLLSAAASVVDTQEFARRRAEFRAWRQERPFWGCVFGIVGGVEIFAVAAGPLKVMAMEGLPGFLTWSVALAAVVFAGVTLFQPHLRTLTGLVVLILGPLSIMATNLGGFIIGMLMLIVGGGLILAWSPAPAAADSPEPEMLDSSEETQIP